jgi:small subunit ribosomal protein S6
MKNYELVLILNPQLSENQIKETLEKSKKIISSNQGEILTEDMLGRKRFYHQIKKNRDGFYVYMKFKAPTSSIKEINYNLKVQENILRVSIINAAIEMVK